MMEMFYPFICFEHPRVFDTRLGNARRWRGVEQLRIIVCQVGRVLLG